MHSGQIKLISEFNLRKTKKKYDSTHQYTTPLHILTIWYGKEREGRL